MMIERLDLVKDLKQKQLSNIPTINTNLRNQKETSQPFFSLAVKREHNSKQRKGKSSIQMKLWQNSLTSGIIYL